MKNTILLLLLLLSVARVGAQTPANIAEQLDALVRAYETTFNFSGTVKVVLDEDTVFEKSYGLADRSFNVPNTPEVRNSINSISKTFTAAAILMLVEEGKIDLQETVATYLPALRSPWRDQITIHQLLTHTSGLPREAGIQAFGEQTLEEQALLVDQLGVLFLPGERYEYSNAGMILLGAILKKVSGSSYAEFIEERIIKPLGLENTGVYRGRRVVERQAVPYHFTSNGLEFTQRAKHFGENAGGGLYSTVSDLYRYVLALEQNQLLSEASTRLLFTSHVESGEGAAEGYAWSIKQFGDEKIHFAAGSGYGTKSVIIRSPEHRNFIGITSNWGNTPILNLLRDIFLLTKGQAITLPSENDLARPAEFGRYAGVYKFEREFLDKHLGIDRDRITLQAFGNKMFLDEELLAKKGPDRLGLSYTDELQITFNGDEMHIDINGNLLTGTKIKP